MSDTVVLASLGDTRALAVRLAPSLRRGDVIALHGDLGTGKTTFAQYLVEALGGGTNVTSPTFTLLQTYPVTLSDGPCELYHYDLYRIEHARELAELGLDEAYNGLTLIEWPERLQDASAVTLALSFRLTKDGSRTVTMTRMK